MFDFSWWLIPVVFGIGFIKSFFSAIAGGGAGLISVPLLIFIGLPPHIAIGTAKMSAIGDFGSLITYIKHDKVVWKDVSIFIIFGIFAAFFGSKLLLSVNAQTVTAIIAFMILVLLPLIFINKNIGVQKYIPNKTKKTTGYTLYFILSIVQAAFGSGVGLVLTYILIFLLGYSIIEASATRRLPLLIMNTLTFIFLAIGGVVHYVYGSSLIAGSALGGYIGAHVAISKGDNWVKYVFAFAVVAMSAKLIYSLF